MIGVSSAVRVWARSRPTDMRKGYSGLAGLVQQELGGDLVSGDLFVFVSRDRRSAKVLHWDGTGVCVYSKRLAGGRFAAVWERAKSGRIRLSSAELATLLEGTKVARPARKKLTLIR